MKIIIDKIKSFNTRFSEKHKNQSGYILKFHINDEAYFFPKNNSSALEWSKIIVKSFAHDLYIEITYDDECLIHAISLTENE